MLARIQRGFFWGVGLGFGVVNDLSVYKGNLVPSVHVTPHLIDYVYAVETTTLLLLAGCCVIEPGSGGGEGVFSQPGHFEGSRDPGPPLSDVRELDMPGAETERENEVSWIWNMSGLIGEHVVHFIIHSSLSISQMARGVCVMERFAEGFCLQY